jgi:hypothetical protein
MIRRIRDLLYDQGFTISGARNQLGDLLTAGGGRGAWLDGDEPPADDDAAVSEEAADRPAGAAPGSLPVPDVLELAPAQLRAELLSIRDLLVA